MRRSIRPWLVFLAMGGCISAPVPPPGGTDAARLARVEAQYADARELYFQIEVTDARGTGQNVRGVALDEMRRAHETLRKRILEALDGLDSNRYGGDDRRAIRTMRRVVGDTGPGTGNREPGTGGCNYDARRVAAEPNGYARLTALAYACYGEANRHVVTPTDTVDRLTVLSRLGSEASAEKRRALFLALAPLWRSVNGDNSPGSPYRTLVSLTVTEWKAIGSTIDVAARSLGLDPARTESTLVSMLRTWKENTSSEEMEPWDWWYRNGAASRTLTARVPLDSLRAINDRFYRDHGADPVSLGVRYDLEPRTGKTPVAFTQFGKPARLSGGRPSSSEAWVFATYRTGGFDNLVELLHESGHAIHISAVETRPAFADWPDSDPYTEALAELMALEAYEPAWQQRYLGTAAPLDASLRAKYASIIMDVAWALFELRVHRDPDADPNAVWTAITREYLHIAPHPEWSWWAMRGQLVDSPGYMMNYALGALIAADLRAKIRAERGGFSQPDRKMYDWLRGRLFRWGIERSSKDVLEEFLGRPLGTTAIITDMARLRGR